jgi:hypothetical protein
VKQKEIIDALKKKKVSTTALIGKVLPYENQRIFCDLSTKSP